MRYAQVTINLDAPLENSFHYHLPEDLVDAIRPGHLVQVEFGRQMVQGLVVALDNRAPVPETKPVIACVLPDPVLNPFQLELGRWLSTAYLTPLADCLRLMLPPGISQKADTTLALAPGASGEARLTEAQQALVNLLREKGDMRGRAISQRLPESQWRPAAEQMVRRGLLRRGSVLAPPQVHPKRVRTVQAIAGPRQIAAQLPNLGRQSRAADVLEWLAANPDPLPARQSVLDATGAEPKHLGVLAEKGYIALAAGRTLVAPASIRGRDAAILPDGKSGSLAERVAAAGVPLVRTAAELVHPQSGATLEYDQKELQVLCDAGQLVQIEEQGVVSLVVARDKVAEAAAELRGAATYLAILRFLAREPEPVDVSWVYAETGCSLRHLKVLAEADLITLADREVWRDPLADRVFVPDTAPKLTHDQAAVWAAIRLSMLERTAPTLTPPSAPPLGFLLHGVTGSGKTEIYLRAIDLALEMGQGAIVLVPEIALTPQTIRRFSARFPGRVTVVHSRLTDGERYDSWRRCRLGMVDIVIGPRSALFAPMNPLGVIVIDEEHEEAYKQDPPVRPPFYHARDAAIELARLSSATLILGSATPDLVTYHRAQRGEFKLLELPRRIMGHRARVQALAERYLSSAGVLPGRAATDEPSLPAGQVQYRSAEPADDLPEALMIDLPPVELIDMRQELRSGNRSIFSRRLANALQETLDNKEQAILFLNRRGTATFVFCRDCGLVLSCPRCDLPLTYHHPRLQLVCHYCGRAEPQPERCPRCGERRVKYFGLGTEQLETEVLQRYPAARVLRWDRDTTGGRGMHDLFLQQFIEGNADILIGTQMIAKGLDLPLVTLVGVISADVSLGLPDYRTGERTFQLLTQVAGRAGRGLLGGRVLIQTYNPEHYAIRAAEQHDYAGFYVQEIAFRARLGYPPYKRLARLEYRDPIRDRGQHEAETLTAGLRRRASEDRLSGTEILGPTQPFFGQLGGRHRWHIVIRAPDPTVLLRGFPLAAGWQLEVDPLNLL